MLHLLRSLAPARRALSSSYSALALVLIGFVTVASAQTPVLRQLKNTGPNASRLNIVILGDGFTAAEQDTFFAKAQEKLNVMVNNECLTQFKDVINGFAIFTASNQSGTDEPKLNQTRDTYYDTGFTSTINDRLLIVGTAAGNARAQAILREYVPDFDISVMMVNTTTYGGAGGGLTVFSLNSAADEVLLHETGHSFARLADEYVDEASAPAYAPGEFINATQKTARTEIPWRDFLLDSTPVPTTASSSNANFVGLWEGAYYRPTGFYRPTYDSKMRSLDRPFGPINLRAFANAVHRLNLSQTTVPPSSVTVQSVSARASTGGTLTLSASAQGAGPLSYQWSLNGKYIAGQVQSTLTLSNVGAASVGSYAVEVTNTAGSTSSNDTGVTVTVAVQGSGSSATYEAQIGSQSVARWPSPVVYVSEQVGSATLTVSRGGNVATAFSVSYATAPGTATSPADYAAQTGTVTWAAGDAADKTISIPIVSDSVAETSETFTVTLSNPSGGAIVGSAVTTVTIIDAGVRDPSFSANFINNTVNRALPLPDGSILIAGYFTGEQNAAGTSYSFGGIARLTADGSLDSTFKPGTGANSFVTALARQPDGKILIGGNFTFYDGVARNRLARLNADGSLDRSFDPGTGANNLVYDFALQSDGKILVGGQFTTINNVAREYLARLNADGSLDSSYVGPDFGGTSGWWVRSLAFQTDGKLLASGAFYFAGTNLRAGLCRLNADGSLDSTFSGVLQGADLSFTPPSLGEIRQAVPQPDGKILICGNLSSYNATSRRGIARLNANGSLDTSFDPGTGADQVIGALLLQNDGKIIVGGNFTTLNGTAATRLARLNADGSLDANFSAAGGPAGTVITLVAQPDGNVLFGSNYTTFQGGTSRPIFRVVVGPTVAASRPVITGTLAANATLNGAFSYRIAASTSSAAFSATGLPAGLSIDPNTGTITGTPSTAGTFTIAVTARNAAGSDTQTFVLTVPANGTSTTFNPARLVNLSILTPLAANETMTLGTALGGTGTSGTKSLLVRAVGPSLSQLGVTGFLPDPALTVTSAATGAVVASNNDWAGSSTLSTAFASVGAFAYASGASKDAAVFNPDFAAGNYTVQITGNGGAGVVIAELYDSTPTNSFTAATPRLINVSVLKQLGAGQSLTAGFVVGGSGSKQVLIRAVGPGLAAVGVASGFIADPQLTLNQAGVSAAINSNNDWGGGATLTAAFSSVGAFALPASSKDAALLVALQPGNYTAQVTGVGSSSGLVLVEVYEVP